jgi:hypothetical protein
VVSDDEGHAIADQLRCSGDRLLGIAEIVRRDQLHLLAEHATSGVKVGYGQRRTALVLLAEPGKLACQWARHSDQDIRSGG